MTNRRIRLEEPDRDLAAAGAGRAARNLVPAPHSATSTSRSSAPATAAHGDFASQHRDASREGRASEPAQARRGDQSALPAHAAVAKIEIAGAGFINFFLHDDAYHARDRADSRARRRATAARRRGGAGRCSGIRVGESDRAAARRARPRTPPTAPRSRNLLEAVGYRVEREYYVNDAGRQMEILAASTWLRYLERCGERFDFPANGYRGDYICSRSPASCTRPRAPRCMRTAARDLRGICRPTSRRAATRKRTSTP